MSTRKLEINRTLILSDWSILVQCIELTVPSLPNMSIIQVTQTKSINQIHPHMEFFLNPINFYALDLKIKKKKKIEPQIVRKNM